MVLSSFLIFYISEQFQLYVVRIGQGLYRFLAHLNSYRIVKEEVKLDGKICLDGVCTIACA